MAWRLARSLETLRDEILTLHPGTTVWTIGDAAHAATWSDHNPNAAGVVCAIDVKGNAGLKLSAFAEHVRARNHRAFKYVIYNRRIASKGGAWRTYHGSNPHTDHVHISVGEGPDGRSTGPYDDTSPWGLLEEDDMPLTDADAAKVAKAVLRSQSEALDLTVEQILRYGFNAVRPDRAQTEGARVGIARELDAVTARQEAILAAVTGQDTVEAVRDELARHRGEIDAALQQASAERAELLALVAAVSSGERDAADVVDEIARRLAAGNNDS